MVQFHCKTLYLDEPAELVVGFYRSSVGALPAWQLYSVRTHEPLMIATVNLEQYGSYPAKGNVIIKDYSENEGILQCLQDAGFVKPVKPHPCGYANAWECEILDSRLKELSWPQEVQEE